MVSALRFADLFLCRVQRPKPDANSQSGRAVACSGIRFDRPVEDVMETVMTEGHEHHYGIVYGDVRAELEALAAQLRLPVIEL